MSTKDPDPNVRRLASGILKRLETHLPDSSEKAVLVKNLSSSEPSQRALAVRALGALNAQEYTQEILALLRDSSPYYFANDAIEALVRLKAKFPREVVLPILKGEDYYKARAMIRAISDTNAVEYHPDLESLFQTRPNLRLEIARALVILGNREMLNHVSGRLREYPSDAQRAVRIIEELKAEECVPDLIPLLRTSERGTNVVGETAMALAALDARETIPRVAMLLNHDQSDTRRSALVALGRFRATEYLPQIEPLLNSCEVGGFAALAMAMMGRKDHADAAERILAASDGPAKRAIIQALGIMEARVHAQSICRYLHRYPSDVIEALRRMRAREMAWRLSDYLDSHSRSQDFNQYEIIPPAKISVAEAVVNAYKEWNLYDAMKQRVNLLHAAEEKLKQKDYGGAIRAYSEILEIVPQDQFSRSRRADLRYWHHDYTGARDDASRLLEADPGNAAALRLRALCRAALSSKNAFAEMKKAYDLVGEKVEDWQADLVYCMAQERIGWQFTGVRCDDMLQKNQSAYAYYRLASSLASAGEDDEAIRIMGRAIEADPTNERFYAARASIRIALGDVWLPLEDLKKAVELNPRYAPIYYLRGLLKGDAADLQGALNDLSRAIELEPRFELALVRRGEIRTELDDVAGAEKDFAKSVELFPQRPETYFSQAMIAHARGDWRAALVNLQEWEKLAPEDQAWAQMWLFVERTLLGERRKAEAQLRGYYEDLIESDDRSWHRDAIALLLGEKTQEDLLKWCDHPNPDPTKRCFRQSHWFIGFHRMFQGDKAGAKEHWEKYLALETVRGYARVAQADLRRLSGPTADEEARLLNRVLVAFADYRDAEKIVGTEEDKVRVELRRKTYQDLKADYERQTGKKFVEPPR